MESNYPDETFDTLEHVLYDFNMELGDSIYLNLHLNGEEYSTFWYVIDVDSINIRGELKKRIQLFHSQYNPGGWQYWIEDIGSSFGPLCFAGISEHEFETELYCYRQNDEKLYGKCVTVGLNPIQNENEFNIVYDKSSNQVNIESPTKEYCTLNIYSIIGTKIFSEDIFCNQLINLNKPEPGIYIFEVVTNTKRDSQKIGFE